MDELMSVSHTSPSLPTRLAQPAGTAGDIQHFIALFQTGGIDGEMFPNAVQAGRHDIVHDVVVFGYGMEHFGHFTCLFFFVYGSETEMGFVVAHRGAFLK